MKVKIADLKTNLSQHLRTMRETGEPIEVCVRETPVAYITSADHSATAKRLSEQMDEELRQRLRARGVMLVASGSRAGSLPEIKVSVAGDGRKDLSTIAAQRAEKEW